MATEEELRDAQILKTNAEAELALGQIRERRRGSNIMRRIGQGIGIGIVLALAGMVLFGPIKDTIEAESKLAALNAKIADRTNTDLQQQLDAQQKQLDVQEQRYTNDLAQLAKDLKKANEASDAAIARSEQLVRQERNLAEKYGRLAAPMQNNTELVAQADAAKERAKQLAAEIISLRKEARTAKTIAANVQTRVDVRPLTEFKILLGRKGNLTGQVQKRLKELGLNYRFVVCSKKLNKINYYRKNEKKVENLLVRVLNNIMLDAESSFFDLPNRTSTLWVYPR